ISAPTPWGVRFFRRGTYHVPEFNEAVSGKFPRADDIRPYTLGCVLLSQGHVSRARILRSCFGKIPTGG
ncbi:MAG: hypothetical protein IKK49_07475, partial [Clostridia bacterium]|nr:hypothetical protein [Clostridia bacterium]